TISSHQAPSRKNRMRKLPWIVIALAAVPLVALAGEMLNVKLREATVRAGPKHFKPVVAVVRYGEQVEVLSSKDGWLEVVAPHGEKGFLHESATTDKPIAKAAADAEGTSGGGARDETSMAGKGFAGKPNV